MIWSVRWYNGRYFIFLLSALEFYDIFGFP